MNPCSNELADLRAAAGDGAAFCADTKATPALLTP